MGKAGVDGPCIGNAGVSGDWILAFLLLLNLQHRNSKTARRRRPTAAPTEAPIIAVLDIECELCVVLV